MGPWLASELWRRVSKHVPVCWQGRYVTGLNEQLKFLRYTQGQHFAAHQDGCFKRAGTQNQSFITLQLYLNEGVEGGATRFTGGEVAGVKYADVDCDPDQGKVLLFQHNIMHEGVIVTGGTKYTVRTDVEYGPECTGAWVRESL